MHNKISVGLTTLVLGAMMLPAAWAQDAAQAGGPPPPPPGMHGRGPGNPDQQLRRMTKELNLNSDQQAQVRQVLVARDSQMSQLQANTTVTGPQRKEQMKAIWMDSDTKIKAVLTDQQKQQFDAMRAQQMERHQGMHGGGGDVPPAGGAEPPMQQ